VTELYAIQMAGNTKSAGGGRSDIESLRRAAGALRAGKRVVEQYVAILHGRKKTAALKNDRGIVKLASDDFWHKITGVADFRVRLLQTSALLSPLVKRRAAAEEQRIKKEAQTLFGDQQGRLRLDGLANPPRAARRKNP
jgi:hypothetical protein